MKDSFIFEGKKYISARRASEISDYASDYVGQLCRAGKLDCRMIGRSWFVTEESIHLHKAAISREEAGRSRIENLRGKSDKVTTSTSVTSATPSPSPSSSPSPSIVAPRVVFVTAPEKIQTVSKLRPVVDPTPWTVSVPVKSPFIYSNDDRPLLPVLNKKVTSGISKEISNNNSKFIEQIKEPIIVKDITSSITSSEEITKRSVEVVAKSTDKVSKPREVISKKPASKSSYHLKSFVSYPELTREIILKRVIAPVFAFALLFGMGTGTYIVAEKVGNSRTAVQFANSMQASGANVSQAFESAYSSVKSGYKSVVAFFTSPSKLAMDVPKEFGDVTVNEVTPNGIVLTSSTGSDKADDAMKQKIRNSFSDDVTINADGSGTAGVITPVFKDTNGKDFIYVMVPVKDTQAQNNEIK
jgi:hypothetical protein